MTQSIWLMICVHWASICFEPFILSCLILFTDLDQPDEDDLETYLNVSAHETTYKPYPNKTVSDIAFYNLLAEFTVVPGYAP